MSLPTEIDESAYGFYCDLEEESPYIYEVIEYRDCHKVVRKHKYLCYTGATSVAKTPEVSEKITTKEKNIYVFTIFVILSLYLFFV